MAFDPETPLSTVRTQANHLVGSLSRVTEIQPTKSASYSSAWRALTHPNDLLSSTASIEKYEEETDDYTDELEDLPLAITLPEILDNIPPPVPEMPPQASPIPDQLGRPPVLYTSTPGGSQSFPPLNQALTPAELRPVTPAVHSLYYVCLMVPRLPQHLLVGALSRQLNGAFNQLCLAYGWRLEYIAVRPDYLLWIVNLSPLTSPNYLMRILRQKTSDRIFESFPDLMKDNPSGDFWAPGYLIMSGSQPPSIQIIRDFIHKTRDHQGIHSPTRLEV
jgi:putative transposase